MPEQLLPGSYIPPDQEPDAEPKDKPKHIHYHPATAPEFSSLRAMRAGLNSLHARAGGYTNLAIYVDTEEPGIEVLKTAFINTLYSGNQSHTQPLACEWVLPGAHPHELPISFALDGILSCTHTGFDM